MDLDWSRYGLYFLALHRYAKFLSKFSLVPFYRKFAVVLKDELVR